VGDDGAFRACATILTYVEVVCVLGVIGIIAGIVGVAAGGVALAARRS